MVTIRLTQEELDACWDEGVAQRHTAIVGRFRTNNPRPSRAELMWQVGAAMSECAAAKYLGVAWTGRCDGTYEPDRHDLGLGIEVRMATGHGPLRVRDKDYKWPPSTPFVLTWIDSVWTSDSVHLVGWETLDRLFAGKVVLYENTVYETDPKDLRPMNELRQRTADR